MILANGVLQCTCMYNVVGIKTLLFLNCTYIQATFIAHSPAFRKGYVSDAFANTEIYNLMRGELRVLEMRHMHAVGTCKCINLVKRKIYFQVML